MIVLRKIGGMLLFILMVMLSYAQPENSPVCRIENGKLVVTLNVTWDAVKVKEVIEQFTLDSVVVQKALNGEKTIRMNDIVWQVKSLNNNFIEIRRTESKNTAKGNWLGDFIFNEILSFTEMESFVPANYGVNKFRKEVVFPKDDKIVFYLAGNKKARNVMLSGTFNDWSTTQTRMQLSDSGWVTALHLPKGKHLYKFIIDGHWMHDLENNQKEDDLQGGFNSVYFNYNYLFEIDGLSAASNVILAGSFNGWNEAELPMQKQGTKWVLPMYLNDGYYTYKLIVDGKWITDPGNPLKLDDGKGNINSVLKLGDSHVFKLYGFQEATKVVLAGTFNNWNEQELMMERIGGRWELAVVLPEGRHEYKFIVDGQWMPDPDNLFQAGEGDYTNSVFYFKPNYTFQLRNHQQAKTVYIAGSFNDWNERSHAMEFSNGIWTFPIYLNKGKHTYKLIVDGKWILDPGNPLWEENEFGTGNSVLWIK